MPGHMTEAGGFNDRPQYSTSTAMNRFQSDKSLAVDTAFHIEGLQAHNSQPSSVSLPTPTSKMVSKRQFISLLEKKNVIPAMASSDEVFFQRRSAPEIQLIC